jgi:hypothetical protein
MQAQLVLMLLLQHHQQQLLHNLLLQYQQQACFALTQQLQHWSYCFPACHNRQQPQQLLRRPKCHRRAAAAWPHFHQYHPSCCRWGQLKQAARQCTCLPNPPGSLHAAWPHQLHLLRCWEGMLLLVWLRLAVLLPLWVHQTLLLGVCRGVAGCCCLGSPWGVAGRQQPAVAACTENREHSVQLEAA